MTEKQNAEMLGCPCCAAPSYSAYEEEIDGWFISCTSRQCGCRSGIFSTKPMARNAWNHRAAAPSPHPRGRGLWSLHKQPHYCVTDHAYSIWFSESEHENAAPVILANASPGDEDKLQEIVDLANAAPPPAGADAVREATIEECAKIAETTSGIRQSRSRAIASAIRALLPAPQPQEKPAVTAGNQ